MKKVIIAFAVLLQLSSNGQTPKNLSSSEIYHQLQKLNTLGSVMYVAAHPDDENTRLISYFSNYHHLETSYFSFTRGNGGQNLISEKLGTELGVIRTQELLNARKIDGGKQYFSTANDFGFSKLPYEAYQFWNQEEMLDQLVYAIRKLQPDIIINRFDHRKEGITHGHHTASAQLSEKAFRLAADPNYQTKIGPTQPWQAKRLFFNVSYWFFGGKSQFEKADKSHYHTIDIGVYYPLLGYSNQEIASKSRSQHQSQGFGDMSVRGSDIEYLEQIAGDQLPHNSHNLLENIDISWKRIHNSTSIEKQIEHLIKNFDFVHVENNVSALVNIYASLEKLPPSYYQKLKLEEVAQLIQACLGLYIEFSSSEKYWTVGSKNAVKYEFTNRSNHNIYIQNIKIFDKNIPGDYHLLPGQSNVDYLENISPLFHDITSSEWLINQNEYFVNQFDTKKNVSYQLSIDSIKIPMQTSLIYKYKDDVKGEIHQPLHITPPVSIRFAESTYYGIKPEVSVAIENLSQACEGKLQWYHDGKLVEETPIDLGEKQSKIIKKTIDLSENTSTVTVKLQIKNQSYDQTVHWVEYDHIATQYYLEKAETRLISTKNLKYSPKIIGYIMGAGDEIPKYLEQLGYKIIILKDEDIRFDILKQYESVLVGIRAYNTREILKKQADCIWEYIAQGGNWVVQYQTNHNLLTQNIAPYPLSITRDRITDENAKVTLLHPDHVLLNVPNVMHANDFTGWIQEQGLYYASATAPFENLLESSDPYEEPLQGALVTCLYGKGRYTYTGLSFFRQIPNGNLGAMKLLINLIDHHHEKK